jgi:UDP-2-acetamido-3-amino-2,3-dideoxy-glucuronate N-acetyltransferase
MQNAEFQDLTPKVAVIGAGYWGKNLVRNFYQLGVLKTICDGAQPIREEMAKTYPSYSLPGGDNLNSLPLDGGGQGGGEGIITPNLSDVLEDDDITGVVIAAPAALHFEIATKVLQAGKHVFVEKPLSLTREDGEALVQLAAEKKKILFVGHILHYHPAVIRLKEMIRAGVIGRLEYIYSRRLSLGKIRREENILWSFAPHDISIILGLTGETPSYVDSVGSNFLHAQIADVTVTNLKFPSGIGAHIFVSWLNPYKEQKLVVVGSNGMFVFDDTEPIETKLVLYPHTINWQNGLPVPQKAESKPIDISSIWKEPLRAECEAFLDAIQTGRPPITSGEEGLRVLEILQQSQSSIEQKEKGEKIGTAEKMGLSPKK